MNVYKAFTDDICAQFSAMCCALQPAFFSNAKDIRPIANNNHIDHCNIFWDSNPHFKYQNRLQTNLGGATSRARPEHTKVAVTVEYLHAVEVGVAHPHYND